MSLTIGMVGHMVAGGMGIITGFVALYARKGAINHILMGRIYVIAMLFMSITGFYYAYSRNVHITMLAALLSGYLVATSWLTIQRNFNSPLIKRILPAFLGIPVAIYGVSLSWNAINGVTDELGTFVVPAIKYYEFALVACIALVFDSFSAFGKQQSPKKKVNQHLWRMLFPLYIACSSLFEGQAKLFPDSLRYSVWLNLPEKIVLLLMSYWLFKHQLIRIKNKVLKSGKRLLIS